MGSEENNLETRVIIINLEEENINDTTDDFIETVDGISIPNGASFKPEDIDRLKINYQGDEAGRKFLNSLKESANGNIVYVYVCRGEKDAAQKLTELCEDRGNIIYYSKNQTEAECAAEALGHYKEI
jgi:hypothetical protein